MNPIVYFADKSVLFAAERPAEVDFVLDTTRCGAVSRAKICKILENHNSVALLAADPDAAFAAFAADFTQVEAAGGVALDASGRALMIHRNGRWDLPKGHLEAGEEIAECAVREVEEETGLRCEVVRPLCATFHAYWFPRTARWELKRTWWYLLRPVADTPLAPQQEEGIDAVVWSSPEELDERLAATFPTIRAVFAAL